MDFGQVHAPTWTHSATSCNSKSRRDEINRNVAEPHFSDTSVHFCLKKLWMVVTHELDPCVSDKAKGDIYFNMIYLLKVILKQLNKRKHSFNLPILLRK